MIAALLGSLWGKAGMVLAALLVLGGGYALVTTKAYNRGHAAGVTETTERMKKAIEEMRKIAVSTQSEWQKKTPGEKTTELQKRCVAACQQEPKCEAACRN